MRYGQLCQKIYTQIVVTPTRQAITLIMLKRFPDLNPLLKVDCFEVLKCYIHTLLLFAPVTDQCIISDTCAYVVCIIVDTE